MNDLELEREIRATFDRRGTDLLDPGVVPPVREVVRKTRRNQLTNVLTAAAVTVALVAASIAGATALLRSAPRPAEPPDTLQLGPLEAVPFGWYVNRDLTADGQGILWWTGAGLYRFEPGTGTLRTFTLADDPAFESVGSIAGARDGGVWIVSEGTVRRFDGEGFVQTLGPSPVCEVAEGPDGTLWGTGCREGVFRWDGATWVPLPLEGRPSTPASALAFDDSGTVWVGNQGGAGGVSRFDGTTWTTWTTADSLPHDHVYTIEPAPDGAVWIGTENGVARFADGSLTAFPGEEAGLYDVTSIAATAEGVWVAGFTGRAESAVEFAARFDGAAWRMLTAEDGLEAFAPGDAQFVAAPDGVWAMTNAGLFLLEGSRWNQRVSSERPDYPALWAPIAARSSDELWVGANGANGDWGIWRIRNGTWTHFSEQDGVPGGGFWDAFAFTADGDVWVSGYRGVAKFDGSVWKMVASGEHRAITLGPDGTPWAARWKDGFQEVVVGPVGGTAIAEPVPIAMASFLRPPLIVVSEDDVWARWFGWGQSGFAHFDGSRWVEMEPIPGARELEVWDMARTEDGALWADVWFRMEPKKWSHALARFDGETWKTIREIDGVPLETSIDRTWEGQLELAPNGDLLFATTWGSSGESGALFRLRDGQWARVVDGSFNAISVAPDGTVWLRGNGGLFRLQAS